MSHRWLILSVVLVTSVGCSEQSDPVAPTTGSTTPQRLTPGGPGSFSSAPPVVTQSATIDWSGYVLGQQPSGWSQIWDPSPYYLIAPEPSVSSGQLLEWSATGQLRSRWGLAYDGFGDLTDQEVYTEIRVRSVAPVTDVSYMGAAAVRMAGTGTDEHGYAVFLVHNPSNGKRSVVLATWVNGGYYYELASYALTWQNDTWYSIRLRALGEQISARIWVSGTLEPNTWQLDSWSANYKTGRPGVVNHDNGTLQWRLWTGSALLDTVTVPSPSGVQYLSEFSEFTPGAQPTGWTATSAPSNVTWTVASDPTASDGVMLRSTPTVTARHVLRYNAIPDTTTTQEVLVKMRLQNDDSRGPGIALRHTMNSNGKETAYVAYFRSSIDQVELNAFVAGGWSFVGAFNFVNNPGQWYWMRFRAEGTTLKIRAWADGTTEPTAWTYGATNSAIAAGSPGLYTYEPNTVDYDAFSVATGGLTAPTPGAGPPPPPPPPPTLTQIAVTPTQPSVQVGGTVQFQVSGTMSDGSTATPTVSWTAAGGSITTGGLYTAGSVAGTYQVTATEPNSGLASSASVTVTAPPPPPTLTTITVSPTLASVQVAGIMQFTVTGTMSDGSAITPSVHWTATGGGITSAGLYTAGSVAGTYQVTATEPGSGLTSTVSVTVTAPPPPGATTWQTGFASYATGLPPSDWNATSRPAGVTWTVVADATASDGVVLRSVVTSTARHILRYNGIADTTTTQEVLVRMRLGDDDDRGPGVALRHTMSPSGTETAYVAYFRSKTDQIEVNAFVNGGWQFIGAASFVNNPGQWYWMRFRVEGTILKVRVWANGSTEPTTWTYTGANTSIAAGGVGVYSYEPNTVDYDYFGVATSGAAAP